MNKIVIVCLASAKADAVQTMQDMGTLHVIPCQPPASRELDDLTRENAALARAMAAMNAVSKDGSASQRAEAPASAQTLSAAEVVANINNLLDDNAKNAARLAAIRKDKNALEPWGSFDRTLLQTLPQNGIYVELCAVPEPTFKTLNLPDGAIVSVISKTPAGIYFAVISQQPLDDVSLPKIVLPETTSLAQLDDEAAALQRTTDANRAQIAAYADAYADALNAYKARLANDIAYARARDGMGDANALAYITGYIPSIKLEALLETARKNSWAVQYTDIAEDDTQVPTLLRISRRFDFTKAIFDFIGILPGYFERDVSIAVYLFLTLFCGMLVGDAGYGVLLSLLSLFFLCKASSPAARNGLKVLLSMSLCTLIFGWLSGNWFGIPTEKVPVIMQGLPWLSKDETQNNIKLLCFFIGAFHTALGHLWKAWDARKISVRNVIGNIGWALFLWANYFAAAKLIAGGIPHTDVLMYALYGVGTVFILAFGINWKDMGAVIYSPFSFINSFVDVLSYIRLFAVGLSGVYIAKSFNDMATSLWDGRPYLIVVGIIILLFGHMLNIVMAGMSILVHGIRLNTLEFSGHADLSWSGKPYKPFCRTVSATASES